MRVSKILSRSFQTDSGSDAAAANTIATTVSSAVKDVKDTAKDAPTDAPADAGGGAGEMIENIINDTSEVTHGERHSAFDQSLSHKKMLTHSIVLIALEHVRVCLGMSEHARTCPDISHEEYIV